MEINWYEIPFPAKAGTWALELDPTSEVLGIHTHKGKPLLLVRRHAEGPRAVKIFTLVRGRGTVSESDGKYIGSCELTERHPSGCPGGGSFDHQVLYHIFGPAPR